MAWCENPGCRKEPLRKADVEFCETTRKVLCHGCFALVHPGWIPPAEIVDMTDAVPSVTQLLYTPKVGFAVQFTEADGFRAKLSYGGASIALHAPPEDLKRVFGI